MQLAFGFSNIRSALGDIAISVVVVLFGTVSIWAHPEKGTPAPPLAFTELLQAPLHARADWASLKGKVVVLDFWATWCSPCIASIPHLNQLVESLDPAKFQFISIDDEDPSVIQAFLTKKRMAGWVGVDTSGGVVAWYGVNSRPTTIIVDGNGKIVAVTEIDSVSTADLRAVAEGRSVAFKPAMEISSSSGESAAPNAATHSLFSVSLSQAAPDAKFSMVQHPPTGTDLLGVDAEYLLTNAYSPLNNRVVLTCSLPAGRYDLRTDFADVPSSVISSVVQSATLSALHLEVQPKTVTKDAYILRATSASSKLLSPSASAKRHIRGYWNGSIRIMNGTMDDLAYELATGLENPVVNETGLAGNFDVQLKFTERNAKSAKAALENVLGLELIQGSQEMSVTVLEVSKQEESKPPPSERTEAPKP